MIGNERKFIRRFRIEKTLSITWRLVVYIVSLSVIIIAGVLSLSMLSN
ncbi:MAG: hypothetical protein GOP50_00860 [Candidatus Heimdallarchaeota archaeon]|nr:hypothetical protein [Candidatus Heimdallarchaeota archaeon]